MVDVRNRWTKWEVDKLIKFRDIEELSWEDIKLKFPNRNIEAVKRKYHRCRKTGFVEDKRIVKYPKFTEDKEKIEQFKKDYPNLELSVDEVMKKYEISSKSMLYELVAKYKIRRNKKRGKSIKEYIEDIKNGQLENN